MSTQSISSLTPVLPVEAIESVLPFWCAIGFEPTVALPEDGPRIDFAILSNGRNEFMLQTHASIESDIPAMAADARKGQGCLFVEVGDLDAVIQALDGHPVFMPRRQTFYGADEIGFRDPAGHYVTFAHFAEPKPADAES
jgi:uncharacterized glyoxalase superfamily protein PhnB